MADLRRLLNDLHRTRKLSGAISSSINSIGMDAIVYKFANAVRACVRACRRLLPRSLPVCVRKVQRRLSLLHPFLLLSICWPVRCASASISAGIKCLMPPPDQLRAPKPHKA